MEARSKVGRVDLLRGKLYEVGFFRREEREPQREDAASEKGNGKKRAE